MRPAPGTRAYTTAAKGHHTLSQTTAADTAKSLHGALAAVGAAKDKAAPLARRPEFASLLGDLERVSADLVEAKAVAEWIARGKQ